MPHGEFGIYLSATSTQEMLVVLGMAWAIDLLFGEPPYWMHPVVWLGRSVDAVLAWAPRNGWWSPFLFGMALTLVSCAAVASASWLLLAWAGRWTAVHLLISVWLLKASFACRALRDAADDVENCLQNEDIEAARQALRSLCSRDASSLDETELRSASMQSLAENSSDSIVAPLLYYSFFGIAGAVVYRTINTLDAMIGYRGPYEALGKFAARLDDVANWIPARVTAGLILAAAWLSGLESRVGWAILCRDGGNTPSPNAGRPMAALAGVLRVQLVKKNAYRLGDPVRSIDSDRFRQCRSLCGLVAWLSLLLAATVIVLSRSSVRLA
ncbi:MAG: cobalamin biosynthesis protein [Gemmatales bacterium]|nr:MAG: cobalamin biosynthesis protein [Gemmatales bacterium]